MTPNEAAVEQDNRTTPRANRVRELVFCASDSRCNTARIVEKGTVFFCKEHQDEERAMMERAAADIVPGATVIAKDRRNRGVVQSVEGTMAVVRFDIPAQGKQIDVEMSVAWLEKA